MKNRWKSWLMVSIALVGSSAALSQTVYRIVGPDGRVTFSDQPPVAAPASGVTTAGAGGGSASGGVGLPFELRQVASRYPVTQYTGPDCIPCGSGRALLNGRGVPFAERTVTTNDDIAALKRLSGETALPFLTIGTQQLRGYSDAEWGQFLDAAGYRRLTATPRPARWWPCKPRHPPARALRQRMPSRPLPSTAVSPPHRPPLPAHRATTRPASGFKPPRPVCYGLNSKL